MSWLLFYLLAAMFTVALIVIGFKSKTWRARLSLWVLLTLPVTWYCWDYFAIKREHERMCAAEGGLRVLIQPEKADRVRLVGDSYNAEDAKTLLWMFFPQLQIVQFMHGERDGSGKKARDFIAITAKPNPRAGQQSMTHAADKEGRYIFPELKVESPDPTVFEIGVHELNISHGTSKETRLSRGGTVYAKYTEFVHWWTGIQYPDALPTWRCPDQRLPDTPILHYEPLAKLILK